MKQKVLTIAVVVLLVGIIGVSSFTVIQQTSYQNLDSQYQELLTEHETLSSDYDAVVEDYNTVMGQYESKVTEYDQLNDTYTVSLAVHEELLGRYDESVQALLDTTQELSELNQTYIDLLTDFEELNVTYYILTGEYTALNATYHILLQQHSQLNTSYYDLLDTCEILQDEYDSLVVTYDQLLLDHSILQTEYTQLLLDLDILQGTYDILLADYIQLQSDHDVLQSDYSNLWLNYNTLWAAHQALLGNYDALQVNYDILQNQYDQLQIDYGSLEQDYQNLQTEYEILSTSYLLLQSEYDSCYAALTQLQWEYDFLWQEYLALDAFYVQLQADFDALQLSYDTLATWIRQQILPAQYMVFAEAVRRYYFEDFYVQNKWAEGNISGYWTEFTRFCRDVILHDSQTDDALEGSWFSDVSNALADCLRYGNQTEYLAFQNFYWSFYPWLPNWAGFGLPVDDLDAIAQVTQWCIDNIDYEYDSDITRLQEPYGWDYIKFPVETAFRTMGDCEDQAILAAAYLESCGFETAMATFHDAENNLTYPEGFYHGVLLVHVDDTDAFKLRYPLCSLWNLGGVDPYTEYTWCWIDTTWDTPFGTEPAWLSYYRIMGMSYEDVTMAVCDLDGGVSYVGTGTGLGAYVP